MAGCQDYGPLYVLNLIRHLVLNTDPKGDHSLENHPIYYIPYILYHILYNIYIYIIPYFFSTIYYMIYTTYSPLKGVQGPPIRVRVPSDNSSPASQVVEAEALGGGGVAVACRACLSTKAQL